VSAATYQCGKVVVAALDKGSDLLLELQQLVLANDLGFCHVSGIGSLDEARMTYYAQDAKEDRDVVVDRPMMLAGLDGTAFRSRDEVSVHAHLVVSDESGAAFAGDLSPGCIVFSCEVVLTELVGPPVCRRTDAVTGLERLAFS